MKHFHISDEKKRLAIEIFNETKLLEEQENQKSVLIHRLTYETHLPYIVSLQIVKELWVLKTAILNRTHKIENMQRRHDQIKD